MRSRAGPSDAGAGDDLAVHGDVGGGKAAHDLNALSCPLVFQHLHPQLGVRGVYRDVDGADVQVNNALHLALREVGKGQVVAHKEGQPGVIIFKI